MTPGSLNALRRERELAALDGGERVDLAVVGGGVTGAGIALDAAARGLSVALIEAYDLAYGTSRWSSKLVHGGLRYLAKGDLALAHESAVERGILMTRTAPHLTRAIPQLFPMYRKTSRGQQAFIMTGLVAGDGLRRAAGTPASVLPRPRSIPAAEALALAPGLSPQGLRGALLAYDGALTDDARLVVNLARTAASRGAKILTRVEALRLAADSVLARDRLTGQEVEIRAGQVINATGVWAGELAESVRLRPSRGSHLILAPGSAPIGATSVNVPVPGENNRFVFLLPQPDGRVFVGVTDEPTDGPVPRVPSVPESDVDFLLEVASTAFTRQLTRADVDGSFAGLRPLVEGGGGRSADLSRKHAVVTGADGVLTVVGGKLTTYRKMAEDAVDAALKRSGLRAGPSTTSRLPLLGATPRHRLSTVDAPARLVAKYGTEAPRIAALGEVDPELGLPLFAGTEISAAEVVWAVRHEGALDVEDVLERRTRLGLVTSEAEAARPRVQELVDKSLAGLV
ncbi:glycerol-3-phosphate dehydrogenase/oxidase [Amycolatopsis sp. BJA-103]|uniref:glycerol-3-phosphate dehydrogenase/oxidase n=1 Tax=Amycolatopsis sp. BJA-103 TaxID=1911175 RepID=UPI000C761B46|nr:glycerol-3-phosphate dehydrogenase/oxidase [Amycolatopsis sp. BJA-103]AUI61862.1 glycerol-3-phosphate dehydrogenase [Amycolatopsis sp. BJA-103]PNE20841.1 glycerol-3-phosphate dehydrogenase [Amycolatopsis sp. BJA-103]